MHSVVQEPRDREGSVSGRGDGFGTSWAGGEPFGPHHIRRDESGSIARQAMGQQQRQQRQHQRKHPEPLRRAVADCLSASHHHTSTSLFPSETVRTLQAPNNFSKTLAADLPIKEDYLVNSVTVDLAYCVLIDHALAERDRSPPVITKCVALLKKYLLRYVPRPSTLQQIDVFCVGLILECKTAAQGDAFKKSTPWAQPAANEAAGPCMNGNAPPHLATSTFASAAALVKSLNYVRALVQRHHLPRYPQQGLAGGTSPMLANPLSPVLTSPHPGGLKWGMPEDLEVTKTVTQGISRLEEIEDEDQD
ncbi:unnamed protein product [Sphagnum balticum]